MTNEELCILIQQGHTEYITELWDRVKKFLYMKSEQIYKKNKDRCFKYGVELDDIKQTAYFAFRAAIKAFKEESNYKFLSFIGFPFRNCIFELIGLRTVCSNKEPLNNCTSLDEPLKHADDDLLTLLETIADSDADFVEKLELEEECRLIRQAVDELDERYRFIIVSIFYENKSMSEIAKTLDVTPERVRQMKVNALKELKENEILRCIYYGEQFKPKQNLFDYFRYKKR